jgi:hypothetical protein
LSPVSTFVRADAVYRVAGNTELVDKREQRGLTGVGEHGEFNNGISRVPGRACGFSKEYGGARGRIRESRKNRRQSEQFIVPKKPVMTVEGRDCQENVFFKETITIALEARKLC